MMFKILIFLTAIFFITTAFALPAIPANDPQPPDPPNDPPAQIAYPTVYTSVWSRTVTDIHSPRIGDLVQQTVTYLITTTATDYLSFPMRPTSMPCTVVKMGVSTQVGSTFIHPTYTHGRSTTYTRVETTVLERMPGPTGEPTEESV